MPKFERELEYVNLSETIEQFGNPKTVMDRVVTICPCGKGSQTTISEIRRAIKKHGNYACISCRNRIIRSDPQYVKKQSDISKRLWENNNYRALRSKQSKELWKNKQFLDTQKKRCDEYWGKQSSRDLASERARKQWSNKNNKHNHSTIIKKKWQDPEYRQKSILASQVNWSNNQLKQKASQISKKLWQDSEYSSRMRNLLSDEGRCQSISLRSKQLWKDPKFKENQVSLRQSIKFKDKMSQIIKGKWEDPEYRSQVIRGIEEIWQDPQYKQKVLDGLVKIWNDPEYKEKLSQTSKILWQDPKYKEKQAKARASFLSSGKDTIIERVTQQILDQLNTPFERQKVIGPYSFDLFVPSHNLLIECQGEYWHGSDKAKQRDSSKFSYIDKYFPDHRILYLYERDFLNPEIIRHKLIRELFDSEYSEDQVDFSFSDLTIHELSTKEKLPNSYYSAPEEFLQSYHRAGFGRAAKQILGGYLGDKLISVCKFSAVKKEVDLKPSQVLELDRFCVHPQYQKENFASWFISRCVKLINDPKIRCLASFADSTFDHYGNIHKTAGWTEVGKLKPSYHYVNKDGWVIHKKTLCNHAKKMGINESEYAEENGYQRVYEKKKVKFLLRVK